MIIAITDSKLFSDFEQFKDHLVNLVNSDVDKIIVREPQLSDEQVTNLLLTTMYDRQQACQKLVVHTRDYVARNIGLTQVHLPQSKLKRQRLSHTTYSLSLHNPEQLMALKGDEAFVLISPVFKTTCKPNAIPITAQNLNEVLTQSPVAVVALGGIDDSNVLQLVQMGFKHVAMRSALMDPQRYNSTINLYKQHGF